MTSGSSEAVDDGVESDAPVDGASAPKLPVPSVKATQALSGLIDQIKKTQTLQTKAAKTTLLQAQAVVRKTQMLDPEALKEFQNKTGK